MLEKSNTVRPASVWEHLEEMQGCGYGETVSVSFIMAELETCSVH